MEKFFATPLKLVFSQKVAKISHMRAQSKKFNFLPIFFAFLAGFPKNWGYIIMIFEYVMSFSPFSKRTLRKMSKILAKMVKIGLA